MNFFNKFRFCKPAHLCKLPNIISYDLKDSWECNICGRIWKLVPVYKGINEDTLAWIEIDDSDDK